MGRDKTFTRGRELLRAWLKEHKVSYAELAELLQVTRYDVAGWVAGRTRPKQADREALVKLMRIPLEAWMFDSELEERRQKLAAVDRLVKARPRELDIVTRLTGRI